MRSAGTFNGTTKTIEVVVQRVALRRFPGAVNIRGGIRQRGHQRRHRLRRSRLRVRGQRDGLRRGGELDGHDQSAQVRHGHPAGHPGRRRRTFEANVEAALDTTAKRNAIKGKSQSTGTYATGLDTVAATVR